MEALHPFLRSFCALVALLLSAAAGCGPTAEELAAVDFRPAPDTVFPVSTPEEQGLDPALLARLYFDAERLPTTYGLLVFANGRLVAEGYFHGGSREQQVNVHSVTKSITSTLVGIALEEGCLDSLDQPMMASFPELADRVTDPRLNAVTLRQMLQMRAGYPWEESSGELFQVLMTGFRPSTLVEIPLVRDPGSGFDYSNLTSHAIGMMLARECGPDLRTYAMERLFGPLGIEPGFWQQDWEGYYLGFSDVDLSAVDLAKFGLLVRNRGVVDSTRIVPAAWFDEALAVHSTEAWKHRVGGNWQDNGYGYQWWSIRAGSHRYHLAWGHGGQQIALVDDPDVVVVLLVDPLHLQHGGGPWKVEKGNLNLVADFVASLQAS